MLANLPAKRATRKIISLKDGFSRSRKNQVVKKSNVTRNNQVKCGKIICRSKKVAKNLNNSSKLSCIQEKYKSSDRKNSRHTLTRRKSLRCISKVLSSRILDTDTTLVVKRKLKSAINRNSNKSGTSKLELNETLKPENSDKKLSKPQKLELIHKDCPKKLSPATVNSPEKRKNLPHKMLKVVHNNESGKNKYYKKNISNSNVKNFFPVIKTRSVHRKISETSKNTTVNTKQKNKLRGKTKPQLKNTRTKVTTNTNGNHIIKNSKLDVGNFLRNLSIRKTKPTSPKQRLCKSAAKEDQYTTKTTVKKLQSKFPMSLNIRNHSKQENTAEINGPQSTRSQQKTRKRVRKPFFREEKLKLLSNTQEFDSMPLLEKVPDTPEKCDIGIELPVLTPAVPDTETEITKNILPDHITDSESNRDCKETEREEIACESANTEVVDMELEECNINVLELQTRSKPEDENNLRVIEKYCTISDTCEEETNKVGEKSTCSKTQIKSKKSAKGLDDCIAMLRNKLQHKSTDSEELEANFDNGNSSFLASSSEVVGDQIKHFNIEETECLETDFGNKTLNSAGDTLTENFNIDKQMHETFASIQEKNDFKKDCSFEAVLTSNQLEGLEKCIPLLTNNASTKEIKGELDHLIDFLVAELKREEISNQKLHHVSSNDLQKIPLDIAKENSNSQDDGMNTTLSTLQDNSLHAFLSIGSPIREDTEEYTYSETATNQSTPACTVDVVIDCKPESNISIPVGNTKTHCKRKLKINSFSKRKKSLLTHDDQVSITTLPLLDKCENKVSATKTLDALKENYYDDNSRNSKEYVCNESEVNILESSCIPSIDNNCVLQASDSEDELPLVVFTKNISKVAVDTKTTEQDTQQIEEKITETVLNLKPDHSETTDERSKVGRTRKAVSRKKKTTKSKSKNKTKSLAVPQTRKQEADFKEIDMIDGGNDSLFNTESKTCLQQDQDDSNREISSYDENLLGIVNNHSISCPEENSFDSKNNQIEKEAVQTNSSLINSEADFNENSSSCKQNNSANCLDMWNNAESSEWMFSPNLQADAENACVSAVDPESNLETCKSESEPKARSKRLPKHSKKKHVTIEYSGDKEYHCSICNKSFVRNEYLVKHMKTLTHIAKLSEIEAQQATKSEEKNRCNRSATDINLCNILQDSNRYMENKLSPSLLSSAFSLNTSNSNTLKLADIINDVLNKPVDENCGKHNTFSNILQSTEDVVESKIRRCKSLGERKSFESDYKYTTLDNNVFVKTAECADSLLEKQISLLENIIVNNTGLNYVDDISLCSNQSLQECNSTNNSASNFSSLKNSDCIDKNNIRKSSQVDFSELNASLKSVQYEEISEDSSNLTNQFEDPKSRKALNRDEELFLECCSLLKSSSEISISSKKSNVAGHISEKLHLQPHFSNSSNFISDTSRLPTPLGDSFGDDPCSSATLPFNWACGSTLQETCIGNQLADESSNFDGVLEVKDVSNNIQGKGILSEIYVCFYLEFKLSENCESDFRSKESKVQEEHKIQEEKKEAVYVAVADKKLPTFEKCIKQPLKGRFYEFRGKSKHR